MSDEHAIIKQADTVSLKGVELRNALDEAEAADDGIKAVEDMIKAGLSEDPNKLGGILTSVKAETKKLEKLRKDCVDAPNNLVKAINAHFKERTGRLQTAARTVERKISEAQRKAQAAQAQAYRDAMAAEAKGQDTAMREAMARSNAAAEVRTPKNISQRKRWVMRVVEESEIPRDWCKPDLVALRRVATTTPSDAKPPDIPGVVFELDTVTATRT